MRALVLDTNIVLDLFVFQDTLAEPLHQALQQKSLRWIATKAMRDELARVLDYPHITKRLQRGIEFLPCDASGLTAQVLMRFESEVSFVTAASKAGVTCRDPDDQKFIDLAVAHQALLLSKDKAVLCMKKRLLAIDVQVLTAIN